MAINYSELFGDFGELHEAVNSISSYLSTIDTKRDDIITSYQTSGVTNLYGGVNTAFDNIISNLESELSSIYTEIDNRLKDQNTVISQLSNLGSVSVDNAVQGLIADMIANSQTVTKTTVTVGSITTSTTNTNVGSLIVTKKLPGDVAPGNRYKINPLLSGTDSELSLTDSVEVVCTSDGQASGTLSLETFKIRGNQPVLSDPYYFGSTGNESEKSISVISGNLISNMFENFTSDHPDGWTEQSGTAVAGTDYGTESVNKMVGNFALYLNGAGSNPATLRYDIKSLISPRQTLCFYFYAKRDSGTTGTMTYNVVVNGSTVLTGTVTDLNTSATSWTLFNGEVVVPKEITDGTTQCYVEFVDTSLASGKMYVDGGGLAPFTWWGGLGFFITQGEEPFLIDDKFSFSITNPESGLHQKLFARHFGVQLPSAVLGTITEPIFS